VDRRQEENASSDRSLSSKGGRAMGALRMDLTVHLVKKECFIAPP
jgi:hypothetical protein